MDRYEHDPLVLVVSVVKDDVKGMMRTLSSVSDQSYWNVMHLVIDADSGDEMVSLLSNYVGKLKWLSERDDGIYDGMNKWNAFDIDFEIICWLNAGDKYYDSETIKNVVTDFKENNWDWLYGNNCNIDSFGNLLPTLSQHRFSMMKFSLGIKWIPHGSVFMRRDFLVKVGKYRLDIGSAADQEFLLRAAKLATPKTLNLTLSLIEVGGEHSKLSGIRRELAWHKIRKINSLLLLRSNLIDLLILPILCLFQKLPSRIKSQLM